MPRGRHEAELEELLGGDDDACAARRRGRAMVTAEQVWDALAEIPDPGDPGDLARRPRRRPRRRGRGRPRPRRLHADVPGLPALEVMGRRHGGADRGARRRAGGRVVLDDSWSTDRITAGREKLRGGGLRAACAARGRRADARPAPERVHRCPYCGSTETSWRTSSARRRAARCATARAAGSRSSSSRRSRAFLSTRRPSSTPGDLSRRRGSCKPLRFPVPRSRPLGPSGSSVTPL